MSSTLAVRADRVRRALVWLKAHNYLYKDVELDEAVLNQLAESPSIPFHVEHVLPDDAECSAVTI